MHNGQVWTYSFKTREILLFRARLNARKTKSADRVNNSDGGYWEYRQVSQGLDAVCGFIFT